MKVGMIIVFDSHDEEMLKYNVAESCRKLPEIDFCFVNNNCPDVFSESLIDIADECKNVTVIHIKKTKSTSLAVRAGARYLNSYLNSKFLAYITDLRGEKLVEAIQLFATQYEKIKSEQVSSQYQKLTKQTFFQKIFSASNYYEKFNFYLDLK